MNAGPSPASPIAGELFVVSRKGEVLLVREKADPGWVLPGGPLPQEGSVKQEVEQKFRACSGLEASATGLLGVFSDHHAVARCCLLFKGALARPNRKKFLRETKDIGWFREGHLPPMSQAQGLRVNVGWRFFHRHMLKPYFE